MSQQYFEFTEEDRKYWSAENLINRLTETAFEDLTWENKTLTKSLDLEKARVCELTEKLAAAEKKIRQLTGVPEPEPTEVSEVGVFGCELVRQYCGMDSYEGAHDGDNIDRLVMDREINYCNTQYYNIASAAHIEDFDVESIHNAVTNDEVANR